MPKINVLDPSVFNMIAAGEVVERPASVVKELVENSIDAGATHIDVDIVEGGLKRIQISDDGIGIAHEDIRTAFMPHATSKLQHISDLDTLSSLGFRGEALASIASVSEVTMISRNKSDAVASKISLEGGKVVLECEDSRAIGTIITIDNLFFNTPARLKFMKAPSAEQKVIVSTIENIIIANPEISFTLSSGDNTLIEHEGGTLYDAVISVYGVETASKLLQVNYAQAGIQVKGYISKTDFSKPTRTWQTFVVNGRPVENKDLSLAIDKAYEGSLVKHNYPVVVLEILLPFDEVDVNVHPRKSEVRFRNKNSVFSAIYHAIGETIDKENLGVKTKFNGDSTGDFSFLTSDQNPAENFGYRKSNVSQQRFDTSSLYEVGRQKASSFAEKQVDSFRQQFAKENQNDNFVQNDVNLPKNDDILGNNTSKSPYKSTNDSYSQYNVDLYDDNKYTQFDDNYNSNDKYFANSYSSKRVFDGKIVGQIFDTYLIVERDGIAYLIDQHAAHERVIYEKLSKKMSNEYIQSLLVPYKFKLTQEESEYMDKIMPSLNEMGFDIDKKFDNYLIYSVPQPVADMDVKKFFGNLFKNMLSDKEITLLDILKDNICQQACKAAIKGGDALSREQIEDLLTNLLDENGQLPDKCPHGRPAIIALTKSDLEKMFKRIV